jgi:hypothetical protein
MGLYNLPIFLIAASVSGMIKSLIGGRILKEADVNYVIRIFEKPCQYSVSGHWAKEERVSSKFCEK